MGQHLRADLGRELFTIATTAHRLDLKDAGATDSTSVDAVLSALGRAAFFLDLRKAEGHPEVVRWLRQPHPFRINGQFTDAILSGSADAIVFFDRVTPVEPPKKL